MSSGYVGYRGDGYWDGEFPEFSESAYRGSYIRDIYDRWARETQQTLRDSEEKRDSCLSPYTEQARQYLDEHWHSSPAQKIMTQKLVDGSDVWITHEMAYTWQDRKYPALPFEVRMSYGRVQVQMGTVDEHVSKKAYSLVQEWERQRMKRSDSGRS